MTEERPVYRHVIVKRRGYAEAAASPEELRRLRQQMEAGEEVDPELQHLHVKDTIRGTMKKVMGWAGHGDVDMEGTDDGLDLTADGRRLADEVEAMKQRGDERVPIRYKRQEGVIVARLVSQQIPGGHEPLPVNPTMLTHPGFADASDPTQQYLECALQLRAEFERFSDRQFRLIDPGMQAGVTLVTVCLTPIMAMPRADVGLELFCEFHQTTRFGYVDTEGFEVYSEMGEFPIQPPSSMDIMLMMKSADEVMGSAPRE